MLAHAAPLADEAVIVITRTFEAPQAAVWKSITEPQHVMQWFGGAGFTNTVCEMDVRPGGLWHHVMRAPDGTEIQCDFVFQEVDAPNRLVWQHVDHGRRTSGPPTCVTTVTLEQTGTETTWKLVARFDSIADRDAAVGMGFSQVISAGFDQLAALLKTL